MDPGVSYRDVAARKRTVARNRGINLGQSGCKVCSLTTFCRQVLRRLGHVNSIAKKDMANTIRTTGFRALTASLAAARLAAGMSQRDLALILDCSQGTINRIETGQRRIDVIELISLSRALDIDPHELLATVIENVSDDELVGNFSHKNK